ncbi:MAG: hypothetical protein A3F91_09610 [Flavobacteria bacterium RIFCSPLOWO2_12_FULL_35_11]|nr:MAG: hypothetical protein A3F91_09610 [Flavobacteria bacterium RIFCSPLOWO2_12_FULL_35_11]
MDSKKQKLQVFVAFLVAFGVSTITLQYLWNWFIAPIGVMELSFAHSVGLVIILIWLGNSKEEPTYQFFVAHIIASAIVLAMGFVAKSFM